MNKEELKKYVEENESLVSMKETSTPGLYVLKYKKRVFYDGLWNEFLEECRGTIVDKDFNIISYPFTKIYNYGIEAQAPVLSDNMLVDAWSKVNGFMVAVTWHNDDILVSTTGSIDSDFVAMAKEMMAPSLDKYMEVCKSNPDYTYMFECVHPNDPHIIQEMEGMHLLGRRKKEFGSKIEADLETIVTTFNKLNCYIPQYARCTVRDVKRLAKLVQHEGFVFYTDEGVSAKIKSPYYLTSKFVARTQKTEKLMRKDIKQSMDEEYYGLIDNIQLNIDAFSALDEQDRLTYVRKYFEGEK